MEVLNVSGRTSPLVYSYRQLGRRGFVIHTTDGLASLAWLQGDSAKGPSPASADFLILRNGTVYSLIPSGAYAYHSGRSSIHSATDEGSSINQAYIGIEHENNDKAGQIVTDLQYQACAEIIRRQSHLYSIVQPSVYGHGSIALPPGRRSDPTRYNWARLFYLCSNPTPWMLIGA